MQEDIEIIQEKLREKLSSKRFIHTIGVRYTAAALAMKYQVSVDDAACAGVLHDCAKYLSDEKLIKRCKKHGIECSEAELRNGFLLHAKLGAYYAKEKYGIDKEEIISAIRYHTTGKPAMSVLEEIVFTADYIEPNRKMIPNLTEIRQMAFTDLDEAVYMIMKNTLSYLNGDEKNQKSKKEIDTLTVEAYHYYEEIHNKKMEERR